MDTFDGFSNGKATLIPVPAQFFSDLLPMIDDLAEMKVTLFCIWALQQKEGDYRYLRRDEFQHEGLTSGLKSIAEGDLEAIIDAALDKAVTRGTLLRATIPQSEKSLAYYFVNTERGRSAVQQINLGEWRPLANQEIDILPERPTIYRLYEDNIGPLTPMIADSLKDAQQDFSVLWIEDAIKCAVDNNARSWRYILKVLESWKQEGRSREAIRGDINWDDKYSTGKWADFIES